PAVGTRYFQRACTLQRTVRLRGDHQSSSADRAVRFGDYGQHASVAKAHTRVHSVALGLVQRATTATEHHARIVTRRASRIECKITSDYVWTVGPHIDGCYSDRHGRKLTGSAALAPKSIFREAL